MRQCGEQTRASCGALGKDTAEATSKIYDGQKRVAKDVSTAIDVMRMDGSGGVAGECGWLSTRMMPRFERGLAIGHSYSR